MCRLGLSLKPASDEACDDHRQVRVIHGSGPPAAGLLILEDPSAIRQQKIRNDRVQQLVAWRSVLALTTR